METSVKAGTADFLTDPVAFRLVLENLIINAIRHGRFPGVPEAIVRVNVSVLTDLDIGERWSNGRVLKVEVEDEGPGIPQKEQRRIFDAFYRGERSRLSQTPGSGLGLHLVNRMAGLLNGRVYIESPYRRNGEGIAGARIVVEIPEGSERMHG